MVGVRNQGVALVRGSIDDFCDALSSQEINFTEVPGFYKIHPDFSAERIFPFHHYIQQFKDIYVKIALSRAVRSHPEFKMRPIKFSSGRYYFFEDSLGKIFNGLGRVYAYPRKSRTILARFENVFVFGGKPMILESSIGGFKKVDYKKEKIIKYNCGSYPERVIMTTEDSLIALNARDFEEEGGKIAVFNFSKDDFYKWARQAVKKYRFGCRNW